MRKRMRIVLAVAAAVTTGLVGVMVVGAGRPSVASATGASPRHTMLYGIYEPDVPSWDSISAIGQHPNIANYYSGWEQPFNIQFANTAYSHGAEIFAELEPWNDNQVGSSACSGTGGVPSLTDIANGRYDSYLNSFAASVRAFGHPVLVTFAHEMNGNWYPWGANGCEHASAGQWISAWDHVRGVVKAGASNADFMWIPNVEPGVGSFSAYWPGSAQVDSVGIDGYSPSGGSFGATFGTSFTDLRTLTTLPVFVAETDVATVDVPRFVTDMRNAGGDGILEYQDNGEPKMNAAQWRQLGTVLGTAN